MPHTRLLNYLLQFLIVILILFTAGISLAQTPQPLPSLPQIQFDPNSSVSSTSAQFDSNAIGVTCGLPESLNRSDGTRCCNTNIDAGAILAEPLNRAPEYFCLGGVLSKIAGGAGGLLSGVIGAVGDVISTPFEVIGDLAQGHFSDAFGDALDGLKGASGYNTVKSTISGIKTDNICLSDAVKLMYISSIGTNPLATVKQPPTTPQPCIEGAEPTSSDYASASCKCMPAREDANGVKRLCSLYMSGSRDLQICQSCASGGGYWTGIGCMKTDIAGFAGSIIGVGMGIGGAATFLCIIYAAFILQTSRGNPEKIKKAQENLRACISGLLLIIFSIFILRLIGVTILQIPGLS